MYRRGEHGVCGTYMREEDFEACLRSGHSRRFRLLYPIVDWLCDVPVRPFEARSTWRGRLHPVPGRNGGM